MLSYDFFNNHPDKFFEFYKTRIVHQEAKPNKALLSFDMSIGEVLSQII